MSDNTADMVAAVESAGEAILTALERWVDTDGKDEKKLARAAAWRPPLTVVMSYADAGELTPETFPREGIIPADARDLPEAIMDRNGTKVVLRSDRGRALLGRISPTHEWNQYAKLTPNMIRQTAEAYRAAQRERAKDAEIARLRAELAAKSGEPKPESAPKPAPKPATARR
ncbi:hypothetical protein [Bailinhaonella thermotolerans]|uniref:Uncharacterized protein n=1 Tax=Bailinhaonella thermotolerans TaxID=1070861 RepID=A0A3A4A045_9ACTN|nr:hypothetical protein [Bailinhaonella thermotolerans]RJL21088.1 hypothetical protein D5H75_38400 [Bailinhaonella thermotolerans]